MHSRAIMPKLLNCRAQKQGTGCNGNRRTYSRPRNFARVWFTGTGAGRTRNALFGNVTPLTAVCRVEELNRCSELATCANAEAQQPEPANRSLSGPCLRLYWATQIDAQLCNSAEAVELPVQKQCTGCNGHRGIYSRPRNFARVWFTGTGAGRTRDIPIGNVTLLTAVCRVEELTRCNEPVTCADAEAQQPEPVNRSLSGPCSPEAALGNAK